MSWNKENQEKTHKYFSIGAAWNQEGKPPSISLDRENLKKAVLALANSGDNGKKLNVSVFNNNRKRSSKSPDFNLAVRIPIEHYPETPTNDWSGTASSSKQQQRKEQGKQQVFENLERSLNGANTMEELQIAWTKFNSLKGELDYSQRDLLVELKNEAKEEIFSGARTAQNQDDSDIPF